MICHMIIKAIRFRSRSNLNRLISHLKNSDDNDAVSFVHGTPADIRDMHVDAVSRRSTYSIRHWIIAPHEATTRAQMREVVKMIAMEFEFDSSRAVVVEHRKKRTTSDATDLHWHVLVGEVDPASLKLLPCSFDRMLHELVARFSEFKFGHRFVHGKHTKSVVRGLRERGLTEAAAKLDSELGGSPAPSIEGFTHAQHQESKRNGIDLPKFKQVVKNAFQEATTRHQLETLLSKSSLRIAMGEKAGTWIVTDENGNTIGSLARLSGQRKATIDKLMGEENDTTYRTTANHRASNSAGSKSDPKDVGTSAEPSVVVSRDDDRHSEQDIGKLGNHDLSTGIVDPEKRTDEASIRTQHWWARQSDKITEHASELLGRANLIAMTPEDRLMAALWEMEEIARLALAREISDFKMSPKLTSLRTETKDLEAELAALRNENVDLKIEIRTAVKPKWWHYLVGVGFLMHQKLQKIETALSKNSTALLSCEKRLRHVNALFARGELSEREQHKKLNQDIARRKSEAQPTLDLVETACGILKHQPSFAFCGLDFVLSRAKIKMANDNQPDQKIELKQTGYAMRG